MSYISMSQKELNKYDIIQRSLRKEITVQKASELLNLSERQIYRLRSRVRKKGAQGLVHNNRGKTSNRRIPDNEREKIIKLLHQHYYDFKPTHASEKLEENHGIKRDPKTIRQIMIDEKLWVSRKRKKPCYRCFRLERNIMVEWNNLMVLMSIGLKIEPQSVVYWLVSMMLLAK